MSLKEYAKIYCFITFILIGIFAVGIDFETSTERVYYVIRTIVCVVGQLPLLYICTWSTRNIKRFVVYGFAYVLFMLVMWQVDARLSDIANIIATAILSATSWCLFLPMCRRVEDEGYGYHGES
ncbi:hypothetical protein Goslar_00100 [Escherichia phage vB_EcoM_Goslar]|uniref:Uncharacterized protein n=1 Tax=Escherichia phage vB_EcoM_Goslar TaxID=2502409 RepID=A0A482GGX0_BPGOS|nr:hypothetical protein HOV27_gp100 [Escherichia phage vB_EcoM_Goslar]QBO63893.1 hypothetical protein Goslar_00100 [Escherichia phage vB_EcoM_Goslar]